MLKPWEALEAIPGTSAVAADWQPLTGEFFPVFKSAFLQADRESAAVFPCRRECGCRHRVVTHASGRMVAVCDCDPWNCEDIPLTPDDVVVWQLNRQKLGRAIARAFGCDAKDTDLRVPGTRQVAAFGSAGLPVVLTIQHDEASFRSVVAQLAATLRERFILLAPTNRYADANSQALLQGARAGFFDLATHLVLTATGALRARKTGGELFSALLPPPGDECTIENARKLYALMLACHTEQGWREAPIKSVFDLYCKSGFSAQAVALKLQCSKATIINRLGTLRQRTGVSADRLRDYKPFFEQIETSLTDPRARRIRRDDAIYGDPPTADRGGD